MVGEVGLDGAARVLWPVEGRKMYDEETRTLRDDHEEVRDLGIGASGSKGTYAKQGIKEISEEEEGEYDKEGKEETTGQEEEEGWKRLTPFKISMEHQRAVLRAQMEVAVEFGVPISLHCVAAPGRFLQLHAINVWLGHKKSQYV
jgi:hypothetical protein